MLGCSPVRCHPEAVAQAEWPGRASRKHPHPPIADISIPCERSQPTPLFLLPTSPDLEPSATSPEPCLPVCQHASHHDVNELNF